MGHAGRQARSGPPKLSTGSYSPGWPEPRRLDADCPHVYLAARYEHIREDERVQAMAVGIAYGIRSDGVPEVLGLDVRASEDLERWRQINSTNPLERLNKELKR